MFFHDPRNEIRLWWNQPFTASLVAIHLLTGYTEQILEEDRTDVDPSVRGRRVCRDFVAFASDSGLAKVQTGLATSPGLRELLQAQYMSYKLEHASCIG